MQRRSQKWLDYLMGFARHAASASKDPSTKVGAALFDDEGVVRLTAFNGLPPGVDDKPERLERPEKYGWVNHAERNVIDFAAREGQRTKGMSLFVTHAPCSACAGSIITAGIATVFVGEAQARMCIGEDAERARTKLEEAGVEIVVVPERRRA